MKQLGLIGYPLSHSFSKQYFNQKFEHEGIASEWHYELFPIETIDKIRDILRGYPNLVGLNVTIPYKEQVLPYLDDIDPEAARIGAVNCIKIKSGRLIGYNTDVYGFEQSLLGLLKTGSPPPQYAYILGTGGAAKAVAYTLSKWQLPFSYVSREARPSIIAYTDLPQTPPAEPTLWINTTPLGMYPHIDTCPDVPDTAFSAESYAYDLVYNPEMTLFLKKAQARGARVKSGYDMLTLQAERGWNIWQTD